MYRHGTSHLKSSHEIASYSLNFYQFYSKIFHNSLHEGVRSGGGGGGGGGEDYMHNNELELIY